MISTVTLNPCNDLMMTIPEFVYGGMNRVGSSRFDYSGKGFNVSKMTAVLEEESVSTGILYTENGEATQKSIVDAGAQCDCVWQEGSIRLNMKIFDEKSKVVSEFNQGGVELTEAVLKQIMQKVLLYAKCSDFILFSGSIPPGCPQDIYRQLIQICNPYCKTVLDAEGNKLRSGIEAQPYMVKPNIFELETAIGKKLETLAQIACAAKDVISQGVKIVCVTMGQKGALITDGTETFVGNASNILVNSTVGAGDCLMGGVLVSLMRKHGIPDALKLGLACAAASLALPGIQIPTKPAVMEMLPLIEVHPYN